MECGAQGRGEAERVSLHIFRNISCDVLYCIFPPSVWKYSLPVYMIRWEEQIL